MEYPFQKRFSNPLVRVVDVAVEETDRNSLCSGVTQAPSEFPQLSLADLDQDTSLRINAFIHLEPQTPGDEGSRPAEVDVVQLGPVLPPYLNDVPESLRCYQRACGDTDSELTEQKVASNCSDVDEALDSFRVDSPRDDFGHDIEESQF